MKVFVFDLDDTLYDEITFVKSGFTAVADYLFQQHGIPADVSYHQMCTSLENNGRGQVFNEVLASNGLGTIREVRKCLSVYRMHSPRITLLPDAETVLDQLAGQPVYIVTDGNKMVQHHKIEALGLYARIKKCYISHRYGRHHSKPSPHCFLKIAQAEKMTPSEIVYVGDNPNKDFVGIKPLGFRTIRIKRGSFKDVHKPEEFNADEVIHNLMEIFDVIKKWDV